MNAAVSRAFHVRECPLSELPLYKITWALGDTQFSSRVLKISARLCNMCSFFYGERSAAML